MSLGQLLRRLRTDRGLTQPDLASRAGVSIATISNVERGAATDVQPSTARMLLAALENTFPLSEDDRQAWLSAAGMPLAEPAERPATVAAVRQAAPAVSREVAFHDQVKHWFDWLLEADDSEHVSYEALCHAVIGVATTLGIRLPPPANATVIESLTFGGRPWPGAVATPGTTIDGRSTTVYSPTGKPPAQRSPGQPGVRPAG